jgi:hypothetical protein
VPIASMRTSLWTPIKNKCTITQNRKQKCRDYTLQ